MYRPANEAEAVLLRALAKVTNKLPLEINETIEDLASRAAAHIAKLEATNTELQITRDAALLERDAVSWWWRGHRGTDDKNTIGDIVLLYAAHTASEEEKG